MKLAGIGIGGVYLIGLLVVTADHVIDRFAFNWGLGVTVVHGVMASLDWPLRFFI